MTEIIDRVTAALADKMNNDPSWLRDISILARTAVAAMREPTPAMEGAADEAHDDYEAETGQPLGRHAVYRAMIDAALAEEAK